MRKKKASEFKMTKPLKLLASELEDMSVISSMCQDALVSVADISYSAEQETFALVANRFCWDRISDASTDVSEYYRSHTGLRFDQVEEVSYKGISKSKTDQLLSLLAIAFAPSDNESDYAGYVMLQFSDKSAIRLKVNQVNVALEDLGDVWTTNWRPDHPKAVQDS